MRKGCDGEVVEEEEKNGENMKQRFTIVVNCLNADQLERRPLVPIDDLRN